MYADRSERGKLRFTGPQRAWFLHQILTQSFEDMRPGDARDAAMITAHGRMQGYLETVMTKDAVLAHFEPELVSSLPETIARYVFATRVEIEDLSSTYGLILVVDARWDELLEGAAPEAVRHPTLSLGVPAGYGWLPHDEIPAASSALAAIGLRAAAEEDLEELRVEHGMARWGREMDPKTFPQEAGVDSSAVHYDKGCYLGQEAMAKIHFRGKVNRRLVRLETARDLPPGTELLREGAAVGKITTSSEHAALALVRHDVKEGEELFADGTAAVVKGAAG